MTHRIPSPAIEDHGIIGDLHTVALVAIDGTIDYMCFPHFDSPSIFAALLDSDRGGCFRISPQLEDAKAKQLYLPDTNVLLTRFLSGDGVAELSDFMPVEEVGWAHNLVRQVKTIRGECRYRMWCDPRFDYARIQPRLEFVNEYEALFTSGGHDGFAVRLRSSVPLHSEGTGVCADFTLRAGEVANFILEDAELCSEADTAHPDYVRKAFEETVHFWRRWLSRSTYRGRWRELVDRSALVLKLLTSQRHGSLLAAPTFGLPETLGGYRNWDYRYTWIRDASFTIYALIRLGFHDEARAFSHWVEERSHEAGAGGSLQIMYGHDGRHELDEFELPHLRGYRGSKPVRIGNDAYRQTQLDIFGELLDAIYVFDKYGEPIHHDAWNDIVRICDYVCESWRQPDRGIWEVRGQSREFLSSRLMCWVALDRGIRIAHRRSMPAPTTRWRTTRDDIYRDIHTHFWNEERQAFVQYRGAQRLDASCMLMPIVRFISPTDRRWISTLRAVEAELLDDSLIYRYRDDAGDFDGLGGQEGTFSICSFWYVECLSRMGNLQKARFIFEKMSGYANHLGLYAEELGPRAEHLGNFPQALTHLGLISAACDLDHRLTQAGELG